MTLKFYDSPFHVTHSKEVADQMVEEVDLSMQDELLDRGQAAGNLDNIALTIESGASDEEIMQSLLSL